MDSLTMRYMSGECHVLALALHRATGYPIGILFDDADQADFGRVPEPTPVHCFVSPPYGNDILDVHGIRDADDMVEEFHEVLEPEINWDVPEADLRALAGQDRPLYPIAGGAVDAAAADIETLGLLEDLPDSTSFLESLS